MSPRPGALSLCVLLPLALASCDSRSSSTPAPSSSTLTSSSVQTPPPAPVRDLAAARQGFVTALRARNPAPPPDKKDAPPKGVQEVEYTSGDFKLKGWLASPPVDSAKSPAVVFLHSGSSFSAQDWDTASAFLQANFVLFMPLLRGEGGNPGAYEGFYGEVSDALAAGEYVKSLPHVDTPHLFLVGHREGGVLSALAAMMPSVYESAASLSAPLDVRQFVSHAPDALVPYDRSNEEELSRRSPFDFVSSLKIPLVLYADEQNLAVAIPFAQKAKDLGKTCEIVEVPGDTATMVPISLIHAIDRLRAASGLPPASRPAVTGAAKIQAASVSEGTVENASQVVAGMAAGFRRCYNKGLKEDPSMTGSVRVTAHIGPNGEVQSAKSTSSPAPPAKGAISETVRKCVQARVESAQFAVPDKGGATIVIPVTLVPK